MCNENMQKHDHLSGLGIMLIGLTSCSVMSYLTFSWSLLISTIFIILSLLCGCISMIMIAADIGSR